MPASPSATPFARLRAGLARLAGAIAARLPIRASTRRFWRMGAQAGQPRGELLHGYAYARWPYAYIGAAIGERRWRRLLLPLFAPFMLPLRAPQRWAASYHGKVVPTESARRLVAVREEIAQTLPEQVIPFDSARDLILCQPEHIVVLDCPCRLARKNPCLPLDVCLVVGEPFASFVLEHHPTRSRAITANEAVAILEAEAQRGHVHHAFFKQAMHNRFYAICNCCSCCCGAMAAQRGGTPMLISSGYVAQVQADLCQGCGACARICPFQAITLASTAQVDRQACMGCGACVRACPSDALHLALDATKPAPLDLAAIEAAIAAPS